METFQTIGALLGISAFILCALQGRWNHESYKIDKQFLKMFQMTRRIREEERKAR